MDSCGSLWLPPPLGRAVKYLQALKTIGWDEYVISCLIQGHTNIPLATVTSGTFFLAWKYFCRSQNVNQIRDVLYSPVRKMHPYFQSPPREIRKALFQ